MFRQIGKILFGKTAGRSENAAGRYFVSSREESLERIKRLGLDRRSEDASAVLNGKILIYPGCDGETGVEGDEAPGPTALPGIEWIIDVSHENDRLFDQHDLLQVLNERWRKAFPAATIYGYSWTDGRWVSIFALGGPTKFQRLKVVIRLLKVFETELLEEKVLINYERELALRLRSMRGGVVLQSNQPVETVFDWARKLEQWKLNFRRDVVIVLRPASGVVNDRFDGRQVWDVLTSLGLRWGDGDLFHWDNTFTGYGNKELFSVWTSTGPGYFFPEAVAEGRFHPADLVFGFVVPRCFDPLHVYEVMHAAVLYAQQRLGGQVVARFGESYDYQREISRLGLLVAQMEQEGVGPGTDYAMNLF